MMKQKLTILVNSGNNKNFKLPLTSTTNKHRLVKYPCLAVAEQPPVYDKDELLNKYKTCLRMPSINRKGDNFYKHVSLLGLNYGVSSEDYKTLAEALVDIAYKGIYDSMTVTIDDPMFLLIFEAVVYKHKNKKLVEYFKENTVVYKHNTNKQISEHKLFNLSVVYKPSLELALSMVNSNKA